MKLENITVIIFLLLTNAFSAHAQNEVSSVFTGPKTILVPEGNSNLVSMDGFFSNGEWDDAAVVQVDRSQQFKVKHDCSNLYFAFTIKLLKI